MREDYLLSVKKAIGKHIFIALGINREIIFLYNIIYFLGLRNLCDCAYHMYLFTCI